MKRTISITAAKFVQIRQLVDAANEDTCLDFSLVPWDDDHADWCRVVAYATDDDADFDYCCDQFNALMVDIAKLLGCYEGFDRGIDWNCDPFLSAPFSLAD